MNQTATPDMLAGFSDALADAVERAAAATVSVGARRRLGATGIIIAGGLVVTADHVIEREEEITVGLPDGTTVPATLVGRDPGTDIAVLKPAGNLPAPLPEGPQPRVGNIVLAIGRGPAISASFGLVNAVGGATRTGRGGQLDGFIRADATLYPGYSGGPLIDAAGRVLGMNTSALWRGNALTIPMATLTRVAASLQAHGKVKRGFLGVGTQPVPLNAAQQASLDGQHSGLLIVGVESGGPAEQGGLLVGDIVVRLAGEQVGEPDDLQRLLTGERIGQATPVTLLRGGVRQDVSVAIGERQ